MDNNHPLVKGLRHDASLKLKDKYLSLVEQGQRLTCHYCDRPIVPIRAIPLERRRRESKYSFAYVDEAGVMRHALIATTDHIIPIRDGGRNGDENLVPSCVECNFKRDKEASR